MRIGDLAFGYGDVQSYAYSARVERDCIGQIACAALYGTAASSVYMAMLLGIFTFKFIIAVVFLGAVFLMCVGDVLNAPTVTLHVLDITLRDGRRCRFVDGDRSVVAELARRIEAAGGEAGGGAAGEGYAR